MADAKRLLSIEPIKEIPEVVVTVPGEEIVSTVHGAGSAAGRTEDKFKELSLTSVYAQRVRPPVTAKCIASLECAIRRFIPIGAHGLLVSEVMRAEVGSDLFRCRRIPERKKTLHSLEGKSYGVLERSVEVPGGGPP
jgi:flavin reductase (DIM6/NTAB) family NADH-FMN oxidoreductase RutF